jgi:hypothetical protein
MNDLEVWLADEVRRWQEEAAARTATAADLASSVQEYAQAREHQIVARTLRRVCRQLELRPGGENG